MAADRLKCVVANRGEIARRILRTAKLRGYGTAVISTKEDEGSPVRRYADEVLVAPSFLDAGAIVSLSKEWGADLLHPGYGYLSENSGFAEKVEAAGIAFVGPTPSNMHALGNKEEARKLAEKLGLPVLKGVLSEELKKEPPPKWGGLLASRGLTFPVLIKAAGGGGGRGMRVVEDIADLASSVERASSEALSAFADGRVFIEKFIRTPRHIEAQILGDGQGKVLFLGERECSLQRRHQKVIEETPSPVVSPETRKKIAAAAVRLASEVKYRNAGTVEFLMDEDGSFYFLEVNTRLQVEHPVTEIVYGVDLVDAQFELAEGRVPAILGKASNDAILEPKGWAIEARVIAEDASKNFSPSPGRIILYREPSFEGVRVDSGVEEGSEVTTSFDSLLSKCVAFGAGRKEAVSGLKKALEEYAILGPATNVPFLLRLVDTPDFAEGRFDTTYIGKHIGELTKSSLPEEAAKAFGTPSFLEELSLEMGGLSGGRLPDNVRRFASSRDPFPPERAFRCGARKVDGALMELKVNGGSSPFYAAKDGHGEILVHLRGEVLRLRDPIAGRKTHISGKGEGGEVRAPMAGKVMDARVKAGDRVNEGDLVFVIESMKMQLEVLAPVTGTVKEVRASAGEILNGPDVLAIVEEE